MTLIKLEDTSIIRSKNSVITAQHNITVAIPKGPFIERLLMS